ncbi:tyrosine-type recombinase/integrase [Salmonella enterica]|uniref:Tyrosine-type recombinase/integrase n=1 Tax=Salmonella enterica TaxID=28901 RepID=A0A628V8K3_SALER|nr:tyrosine-type recombinase/integrase [Salmonella enterica]EEC6702075.1 tyrosine-type recombinase/integrase [Salmonella enterica]ELF5202334.1 tyrosine-type recombinase/integrase [Salmonella enterica]
MSTRKFLTRHEISSMLQTFSDCVHAERNRCLIMMAFIHGFRASELLSLRLADLDMGEGILLVTRLKNGFSTVHPLTSDEITVLRRWLRIRQKILVQNGDERGDWLFITRRGTRLSRQQFYNIIRQAGQMAGLNVDAHPHMLRHACGYALADNGVDTRLIQDYLGHRNIRHTVRYTASSAARFEGIWRPVARRGRRHSGPKCKPVLMM